VINSFPFAQSVFPQLSTMPQWNINELTIIQFMWANKRHILTCFMMFFVSIAMAVWDIDNVIAEAIANRIPLQWTGNLSWNHWSSLILFAVLFAAMVLGVLNQRRHRVINLNRVGRVRR